MKINDTIDYEIEGNVAVIATDSPPVNALSAHVRQGLADGVRKAIEDRDVKAIVLICRGRTFFAGADITEFGKPLVSPSLPDLLGLIEDAPKPVIAAMHGSALGGGLELSMVAQYRIATPTANCGLPEVDLGIIPGAGGTQRLPRIVGVELALDLMTSGRQIGAQDAQAMGLLDEIADGDLRRCAIDLARRVVTEARKTRRIRDSLGRIEAAHGKPDIFSEFRKANARRFRGFLAPEYCVRAIEAAVTLPFEDGLKEERRLLNELLAGSQSAAQRHVFFAERQAAKAAVLPAGVSVTPIRRLGVVGAGTMGGGIAMSLVNAGLPVTIVETSEAA
jgi:3-hydroxyacyl-CoA dehydrogenase